MSQILYGTIVKHGSANYLHEPKNSQSYYVELQADDGAVETVWGVGLQQALFGFQPGAHISLVL